jgi:flavin-dependent dehydrogenase
VRDDADVLVVGAGLAGLHTATLLARRGHEVLLAERRPGLTGAIRTTGIFVRKTLDDFPLPRSAWVRRSGAWCCTPRDAAVR